MNKYTPGPWRFDKDNLNVYSNGMIAQTFGHIHNGERAANASLIAASPDLFESLVEIFGMIERGELVRDISFDGNPDFVLRMMEFVPRLHRAQLAISKAKVKE